MRFEGELWVPAPLDEVFDFFSDAHNLERITPPWLRFHVETPGPIVLGAGTRIDYRLRIHGFPMMWQSEIIVWEPPHRFVDEQRRGPYRKWVHTHSFRAQRDGTSVMDSVQFEVPLALVAGPFVRRDVEKIFAYRTAVLREIFGTRR
jgi:ligand-binding SRPBCC domain-containing protein